MNQINFENGILFPATPDKLVSSECAAATFFLSVDEDETTVFVHTFADGAKFVSPSAQEFDRKPSLKVERFCRNNVNVQKEMKRLTLETFDWYAEQDERDFREQMDLVKKKIADVMKKQQSIAPQLSELLQQNLFVVNDVKYNFTLEDNRHAMSCASLD